MEIGELHERDKFQWEKDVKQIYGSVKHELEFEFKMNHIKQIVKLEIMGNFTPVTKSKVNSNGSLPELENRSICKS